ncbi:MAG: TetR/AcrR family transcriptional regulator C-terminal domain-containing protein [Spirochaetaceae bacterium]|jgi:AcrR family transcriptional regulator|nr:TetR/AcrR family transcriptional regulator C-terminal domain-containing protein [Spirochaetaceae bacterium]
MIGMKLDRKTRYTRKVLADSLVELMKDKPFSKITIKELCEKADINRTTFYAHYRDQYDLLLQIEEETLTYFEDMLAKYDARRSKREILEMVEEMLNFIANNSNAMHILLSENGDIDFQKKVFHRFMQKGLVTKYFSEKTMQEEMYDYWYAFVVNGAIGLIQYWLKNDMSIPIRELAKILVNVSP